MHFCGNSLNYTLVTGVLFCVFKKDLREGWITGS